MTEPTLKRKRVTVALLSSSSASNILVPQDANKEKLNQIQIQIEKLEAQNYKFQKQIECANVTHELSVKESTQKIAELITENNESKARAIHHMNRADEATKTLEVMKAKHIEVTNKLRGKLEENRKAMANLEDAFRASQVENETIGNEADREATVLEAEVEKLTKTISILKETNAVQSNTVQNGLKRELELNTRVTELENKLLGFNDSNADNGGANNDLYNDLQDQYQRVCKHSTKLENKNAKLASELKHYKSISQNVELLREERNSLKDKLAKLNELENTKFTLQVENANLKAEREAWTHYLNTKPEYNQMSPGSIVYNLSKQADEAQYLSNQVKQMELDRDNQIKLTGLLEDHVAKLKAEVIEKEAKKAQSDAAHILLKEREDFLKIHVKILQDQLQLYDTEEKNNMEASYDSKKALRIAQLEMLLREAENKLKSQTEEWMKMLAASKAPITVVNGPDQELPSGRKIVDFVKEIYEQYNEYIKEFKEAKEKYQKQYLENHNQLIEDEAKKAQQANIPTIDTSFSTTTSDQEQSDQRILSLLQNPAAETYSIRREQLERLQKENRDLIKMQAKDVHDLATVTLPKSSITNYELQITSVTNQLEAKDRRIQRMRSVFDEKVADTRSQIRSLLGYDVVFRNDGAVRLESIFVDGAELAFLVKEKSQDEKVILRIVGTNKDKYMHQLQDDYNMYIAHGENIPAFLNSAAINLYVEKTHKDAAALRENHVVDGQEEEEPMLEEEEAQPDTFFIRQDDDFSYENAPVEPLGEQMEYVSDQEMKEYEQVEHDGDEESYEEVEHESEEGYEAVQPPQIGNVYVDAEAVEEEEEEGYDDAELQSEEAYEEDEYEHVEGEGYYNVQEGQEYYESEDEKDDMYHITNGVVEGEEYDDEEEIDQEEDDDDEESYDEDGYPISGEYQEEVVGAAPAATGNGYEVVQGENGEEEVVLLDSDSD